MYKLTHFTRLALGLLGLQLLVATGAAADAPVLSLRPSQANAQPGQTVVVEVWLAQAPVTYGVETHLTFDPTLLEVVDADPALAGVQVLPGAFMDPEQSYSIQNQADNAAGTIDYAATLLYPAPAVTGSGHLVSITFRALQVGRATVSFTEKSLLGAPTGETLAPVRQGLQLNIAEGMVLPLPEVQPAQIPWLLGLVGGGLILLWGGWLLVARRRANLR